jgi:hypothetical protein
MIDINFEKIQELEIEPEKIEIEFLEIPTAPEPEPEKEKEEKLEKVEEEKSEAEKKALAVRNATMYVTLVDLIVSRGCSLIAGGEIERYKLSKSEKEEYSKVSEEYFLTINANVSPAAVFIVSTLTIFSSIFFRAFLDYKAKKKKKEDEEKREADQKRAAAAAAAAAAKTELENKQRDTEPTKTISILKAEKTEQEKPKYYKEEILEAKNSRSNFEIYQEKDKPENSKTWTDSLIGKYKRSPENDRWTYEECLKAQDNEPTEIVKMLINQKLSLQKSWKDINLEIRKFLKSLPSFLEDE